MQVREGYKQTEVGVIPEDWVASPLAALVIGLDAGVSVNSADKDKDAHAHDKSILKTSCVMNGKFLPEEHKRIHPRDIHRAKLNPRKDSIVISRMNTPALVGECGYIENDYPNLFLPDRLWMTKHEARSSLCVQWLSYLLSFGPINRAIKETATGTSGSMKNISKGSLLAVQVPLPPDAEQRAIASALSKVDALLAAQDKLIAKKRDIKQAAMQQLLTGKQRLPGFTGEWEARTLKEIITPLKKTSRLSSSGKNEGIYPFFTNTTKPVDKFLNDADFKTEAIIANTGGEAYFNYYNGSFAAMSDCFVFETSLVTRYVYYFLKSIERTINDTGFTGSGIKHLDKKLFYQTQITFPATLIEQTAIATILSDMDADLTALEQQRDKTRNIKQGMMQELLTGRIRLV